MKKQFSLIMALVALAASPVWAEGKFGGTYGPQCGIKHLNLTKSQSDRLKSMRLALKSEYDGHEAFKRSYQKSYNERINNLMTRPTFDEATAKKLITDFYRVQLRREISELKLQHALFQMLDPEQKKDWLNGCAGDPFGVDE
ncbi:Spy/CpxP family protein refolding chaperone [Neisseriaceae bacterium CLB008]|nr:Spy/CpxP family protein refolding chaperone [Neisseriaceae bacterium]